MKRILILISAAIVFSVNLFPQSQVKVMDYNLLNYPGTDTTGRNPYFRTVIHSVQPDILVVQEITSQAGVNGFLNNVINSSGNTYSSGIFIDGPDTDNEIFFKTADFTFISHIPIHTYLCNISEFRLKHNATGDTLILFSFCTHSFFFLLKRMQSIPYFFLLSFSHNFQYI